jgi:hypothetical protein
VRRIATSLGTSPGLARRTAAVLAGGPVQRAAALPVPDVRSLPVAGAAASVAQTPLRATRTAAAAGGFPAAGPLGVDPSAALTAARSAAAQEVSSATRGATAAAADLADATGSDVLGRAQSAAARVAGGDGLGALGAAVGAARDPAGQLGYLLEALEERVVAELERRGGRYAGAF